MVLGYMLLAPIAKLVYYGSYLWGFTIGQQLADLVGAYFVNLPWDGLIGLSLCRLVLFSFINNLYFYFS